MQRQAVPLLKLKLHLLVQGLKRKVAVDSRGSCNYKEVSGTVTYVDAKNYP